MPFTIGETIGAYRLVEKLGQGGMATVFKAYHAALDRYVAIKVLHPFFHLEEANLARFRREAQVVARLEHPNIVPVYDFAEHEGRPYLVMKYIDGETLKARLSHKPIAPAELLPIVESVGAGLDYAHKQGVLHRDIKPSNVLLAEDGRIYLTDFGLARIAQAGESTLSADMMLGTPQYISPEQARGDKNLDHGTDIYSFGVMLYELIVGRVPYSADTPFAVIHDHLYTPLPPPCSVNPEIPEPIERFLLKALAKERADRFEDVAAMMAAWKQAAAHMVEEPVAIQIADEALTVVVAEAELAHPAEEPAGQATAQQPDFSQPPVESASPPPAVAAADTISLTINAPKASLLWLGVMGAVLLILLGAAGAYFIPRLIGRPPDRPLASQPVQPEQPGQRSPEDPFSRGPRAEPMSVEQALKAVEASPEDLKARLSLAQAYLAAGMQEQGENALREAEALVGDPYAFYSQAADFFFSRQSWFLAARLYLISFEVGPEPSAEIMERAHQSLYLAARFPEAVTLLERARPKYIKPEMMEVVMARSALYHDDAFKAEEIINGLVKENSGLWELKLLEAELAMKKGEYDQARVKLEGLIQDPGAAPWIHEFAKYLLELATAQPGNAGVWKLRAKPPISTLPSPLG